MDDFVFLNSAYSEMKTHWASHDGIRGFWRIRGHHPEEVARMESQWGRWYQPSDSLCETRSIRPAMREEVEEYVRSNREWSITTNTDLLINDTRTGMSELNGPARDERAAEEIADRLRELGWLEELVKMKREDSDALRAIDDVQLLEMVLQKGIRDEGQT